jgi:hypothetical protein
VEERSREMEDMREAERRARLRVDELITEVRAK